MGSAPFKNIKFKDSLFFLLIFLYQLIFIFQGLDVADEGFYATFYQQIFHDPHSVGFNFMYWFSGIVGGAFYYLFPGSGILGFRILGVLVQTLTIIISYNFLKKYIPGYIVKISLLIVTMLISNDPKEMYYNNLSALFFVISAIYLVNGLNNGQKQWIILSGVILSLNFFTRVSSVAGLSFFVIILYDGFLKDLSFKKQLWNCLQFFAGFMTFTLAILAIMQSIGHLEVFMNTLNVVYGMGSSSSDTHSLFRLMKLFITDYSSSIIHVFIVSIIFTSALVTYNKIKSVKTLYLFFYLIVGSIFIVFIFYAFYKYFQWISLIKIITGACLFLTLFIITLSKNVYHKQIALAGSLILLFAPLGSAGGLYSMGRYSLWLIFPVLLYYIFKISSLDLKLSVTNGLYSFKFYVSKINLIFIRKLIITFIIIISVYYAYYYPYFDMNNRINMHYPVNNRFLKGVYTSKSRAEALQQLLSVIPNYVKKNDYIFAYDCIPLIHYLTETRPYLYNSWPWTFYPEIFNTAINKSAKDINYLPVVVLQKVNTCGSNWPDNKFYNKTENDKKREIIFNSFLKRYNYQKAWGNVAFDILLPSKSQSIEIGKLISK